MLKQVLFRFLVIATMALPSAFAQVRYQVTDLGTLPGTTWSWPDGINNNGQIVGVCQFVAGPGPGTAFVYSNATMTALGTTGYPFYGGKSLAYAINNHGLIVGQAINYASQADACLWDGGAITDLGKMGGNSSIALGINDAGAVVGNYGTNNYGSSAFLYTNGVMVSLGTLGGTNSSANGINNARQIAGSSKVINGDNHAFLYDSGTMIDLSTLGGSTSTAAAINQSGQIVGSSILANGQTHAFLYSAGVMTDLGSLPGDGTSYANAINNSGQIVGNASSPPLSPAHAFIYDKGIMTDLNNLISPSSGWTLGAATGINDKGQIVGQGTNPSHQSHAYLLTPYNAAQLSISPSDSDVVISWPTNTINFSLFQNSDLSTTNWTSVTNTVIVTNGQNQVVVPGPLIGNCLYRLQSQ
jgi:probable HAF family extracellular repeat protein